MLKAPQSVPRVDSIRKLSERFGIKANCGSYGVVVKFDSVIVANDAAFFLHSGSNGIVANNPGVASNKLVGLHTSVTHRGKKV